MPTYKCFPTENGKYINKKEQCPSYTDRILFKKNDSCTEAAINKYSSIPEVFGSDHRPVMKDITFSIALDNLCDPEPLMDPKVEV